MRNGKCFVEIEVTNIGTNHARTSEPYLGIHVGTIHVNKTTLIVYQLTNFANGFFKYAMGRRIGNHQSGQGIFILKGFLGKVGHVDITSIIAFYYHHFKSYHYCAGRVGTMGTDGYQYYIAVLIAMVLVIGSNGEQTSIFALGTAIGLQAAGSKAGNLAEILVELLNYLCIALALIGGCKWMESTKFGPANGHHFGGCIQLHGATA